MDIEGLGTKIIDQLVEAELISDVADLYSLKYEQLVKLDRFAEKSARNLIEALQKSRTKPINCLLFGLGIRHVGERAARILADRFSSLEALGEASVEELTQISEIGPVMAQSVVDFFSLKGNQRKRSLAGKVV